MCRFVGLMLGSGEGHFCQFISSRLGKNINTTHIPTGRVVCRHKSLQGKTLGRRRFGCEQLNFFNSRPRDGGFTCSFCWGDLDSLAAEFLAMQTVVNNENQCDYLLRAVLLEIKSCSCNGVLNGCQQVPADPATVSLGSPISSSFSQTSFLALIAIYIFG